MRPCEIPILMPHFLPEPGSKALGGWRDTGCNTLLIRAEEAALEKLRQVKRGLMDDLLTEQVRVGIG